MSLRDVKVKKIRFKSFNRVRVTERRRVRVEGRF